MVFIRYELDAKGHYVFLAFNKARFCVAICILVAKGKDRDK
jgi:hypothetical protein